MSNRNMGIGEAGNKTIRQALLLYRDHLLAQGDRQQQNREPAAFSEGSARDDTNKDQLHSIDLLLESFKKSLPPTKDEFDPLLYPALCELEAQPTASPFSDHWILPDPDHSTVSSKTSSVSEDWGFVAPTSSGLSAETTRLTSVHSSNVPTAVLDSVAIPETNARQGVDSANSSQIKRKPVPEWSSQTSSSHHSQPSMPQLPKYVPGQYLSSSSPRSHDAASSHTHPRSLLPSQHFQQSSRLQSISQAAAQLGPEDDLSAYLHTPRSAGVYAHPNATASFGSGFDGTINPSATLPNQSHCCGCCFGSAGSSQIQPVRSTGCHPRIESRPMPIGWRNQSPGYTAYRPFHARVSQQSQPEELGNHIFHDLVTDRHPFRPESTPAPALRPYDEGRPWLDCGRSPQPSKNTVTEASVAKSASPGLREQVTFNKAVLSAWNRPRKAGKSADPIDSKANPSAVVGPSAHSQLDWRDTREANVLDRGRQRLSNDTGNAPPRSHLNMPAAGIPLHGGQAQNESMQQPGSWATYIPGHLVSSQASTNISSDPSSHSTRSPEDQALHHSGPSSNVLRPSGFTPLKQQDSVLWPSGTQCPTLATGAPHAAPDEVKPNTLRPRKSRIRETQDLSPTVPGQPLPNSLGSGRLQKQTPLNKTGTASPRSASPPTVSYEDLAALQKLQDQFNLEDEATLAKQEAFARQVQNQVNDSAAVDSNVSRPRGQRGPFLSSPATNATQYYGAAEGSHDQTSSRSRQSTYTARNAIEFAPGASGDEAVQHLVVMKQPTIINASSSGAKRQSNANVLDNESLATAAAQEIAKYEAAQREQQDVAKEAARKKRAATKAMQAPEKVACAACHDKDSPSALASLQCGHHYCGICIADGFKHALGAGKVFICCNKTPVPVAVAAPFLPADFVTQYKTKLEERTTSNPVYCAKPGCSAFIAPRNLKGPLATCEKCGFVSCSLCKNPEHKGVCPPDKLGQKLMNLAGNRNWVQCTRCKAVVERDDGCLHMTCTCGYEFCYSCGGPWDFCGASCPRKA